MLSGHGLVNGSDLCKFLDEVGRVKPLCKSHVCSLSHENSFSIATIAKEREELALIHRYGMDEKKKTIQSAGE